MFKEGGQWQSETYVIIALVIPFVSIVGCATVVRQPEFENVSMGIKYRLPDCENIINISVLSESGEILWHVIRDISYVDGPTRFTEVQFGRVPSNMREMLKAKPLNVGDKINWVVTYRHVESLSISTSALTGTFEVVGENQFRYVGFP